MNDSDTSWTRLGAKLLSIGLVILATEGCSNCNRTPGLADTKGQNPPTDVGRTSTAPSAKHIAARPARTNGPPAVAGFRRYDLEPCQVSVTMPCEPELKLQGRRDPSGKPQSLVYLANCGAVMFGITCSFSPGGGSLQAALETSHRSAVEGVPGSVANNSAGPNFKLTVVRSMRGLTSIKTQILASKSTISMIVAPTEGLPEAQLSGFLDSLEPYAAD